MGLRSRWRSLLSGLRPESPVMADMEEEFRTHVELRAADLERSGLPQAAARRQALLEFGSVERYREEGRHERGLAVLDEIRSDVRYAARALGRTPGFTAAAVLTLALGLGATAAVVDVIDQLFFRPLPLHEPARLVEVQSRLNPRVTMGFVPEGHFGVLREGTRELQGLAGVKRLQVRAGGGEAGASERAHAVFVTDNYFDVLGVSPAVGRSFDAAEYAAAERVAVVSHEFWQRRGGGLVPAAGAVIQVEGQPVQVVGVMPAGFGTSRAGLERPDLWLPLPALAVLRPAWNSPMLHAVARLAPGVTRARAEAELSGLMRAVDGAGLRMQGVELSSIAAVSGHDRNPVTRGVLMLGLAAALLLLLAALNVSGLLLARSTARRHEIGIRLAIGASRARIARQLVTEGSVLFLAGGVLAMGVSHALIRMLAAVPWPVPVFLDHAVRLPVLAVGFAIALASGITASLIPALHASSRSGVPVVGRESGLPAQRRVRTAGVVLQLALSVVLLVGAALFVRALQRAWNIDLGFEPDRVAAAVLDARAGGRSPGPAELDLLLTEIRSVSGVESAALASAIPSYGEQTTITVAAGAESFDLPFAADSRLVTPFYFATMGIEMLAGREFSAGDTEGADRVVIVSHSLAERLWPGELAVGRQLGAGATSARVVGVAGDVRSGSLRGTPTPVFYLPYAQAGASAASLLVVAARDAATLQTVRQRALAVSPALADVRFEQLRARIAAVLLPQRTGLLVLGGLALFGLALAALGLYGILAYAVATRTSEIGVRMALGARRSDVLRHFLMQGLVVSMVGVVCGLLGAAALTRIISGLLYGVSAWDPVAYGAAACALLLVGAAASFIPARRAAGLDPTQALRTE